MTYRTQAMADRPDQPAAEVRKDEPLAEGLVGDALEESFEKEVV